MGSPRHWKPRLGSATLNPGHSLSKGLVGCWLLNEGAGTRVWDLSGKGNIGTLVGPTHLPVWAGGSRGQALNFDGVDDYVSFNSSSDLPYGANARSFVFWLNPASLQTKNVLGYGTAATAQLCDILLMAGGVAGVHWYGNTITGEFPNTLYSAGIWQHFVFTYDGTAVKSYINGVFKDTYDRALNTVNSGVFATRGIYSPNYFSGLLGDLLVYNRALSVQEIRALYVDPYCFLIPQAPSRRFWAVGAAGGLSIPVAMRTYRNLRT